VKRAFKAAEIQFDPTQIWFGNTVKSVYDIQSAYALGVRIFAVDSIQEVDKLPKGVDVFL
jgi:diaminopimelate decarboxylase